MSLQAAEPTALTSSSPFSPPATAAAVPAAANEQYEFAGVSTIGGKSTINIYDKGAKKGRWIEIGETADNIAVVSYDAGAERVVVKVNGAEKTLSLRKSAVSTATTAAIPAVPVPMPMPAPQPVVNTSAGATYTVNPAAGSVQPAGAPLPQAAVPAPAPAPTPAAGNAQATKQEPPRPGTVAYEEQEARMLVSDLLEIGMAQRRAYEAAQRKAAEEASSHPSGQPQPPTQGK